jgi:dTDP-glucose pyrophosphorylase
METTLVVMAAGMGSRFGGLKQIEPVDKYGHILIDYSIYDAILAGFRRVVFVINREIERDFKDMIASRISKWNIEVDYAFQEMTKLPDGYSVSPQRKKPLGTAHAIACLFGLVNTPFAVINADDFYGRAAFIKNFEFLTCWFHYLSKNRKRIYLFFQLYFAMFSYHKLIIYLKFVNSN